MHVVDCRCMRVASGACVNNGWAWGRHDPMRCERYKCASLANRSLPTTSCHPHHHRSALSPSTHHDLSHYNIGRAAFHPTPPRRVSSVLTTFENDSRVSADASPARRRRTTSEATAFSCAANLELIQPLL